MSIGVLSTLLFSHMSLVSTQSDCFLFSLAVILTVLRQRTIETNYQTTTKYYCMVLYIVSYNVNNFSSDPTNHAIPTLIIQVTGRTTQQTMSLGYLHNPLHHPSFRSCSISVVYGYAGRPSLLRGNWGLFLCYYILCNRIENFSGQSENPKG